MYLKVVCAWCGRLTGTKEVEDTDKPTLPITHSICPECSQKLEEETQQMLQRTQESKTRKENNYEQQS
jgi:uncharacterized protein YlaI